SSFVTLPLSEGETARERGQRVTLEKASARLRPCTFCTATVEDTEVDNHSSSGEQAVMTMANNESPSETTTGAAKRNGSARRAGGSPLRKPSDQKEKELTSLYSTSQTPVSDLAKKYGIGESSVYRIVQKHGAALRGRSASDSSGARKAAAGGGAAAGR